jgi:NADH:ubiquinone oxidoreductase subunit F (NADH-binding)
MANDRGTSPHYPLDQLRTRLRAGLSLDEAAVATARALGRPVAPLLAAARSHADLLSEPRSTRVCRGTSCELAGAALVAEALTLDGPVRPAHCLGHCHRSPVVLDSAGSVLVEVDPSRIQTRLGAPAPLPAAPRIDCLAAEPIVTRRIARGDFSLLGKAQADGAWSVLADALTHPPERVLSEVEASGERGRGGSGYPTGAKWRAAARSPGPRVVIANGDEGDPGSFVDRVLLESDPHGVLEGLALCAYAVGAEIAVVFVRSEYPRALERMRTAVRAAEAAGLLGERLGRIGPPLSVTVIEGFGSYVCGEETALIATLEGARGEARPRPPFPVEHGLGGRPTVVNNVETLVNVPWIVERGARAFSAIGTPASNGSKALCLNAGFAQPGVVEVPFGTNLRDVIQNWGATPCRSDELSGVLAGGPMGSFLAPEECDVAICWQALAERGVRLGHGGLVAVRHDADLEALVHHLLAFMAEESCGRCLPCRAGSAAAHRLARAGIASNVDAIRDHLALMREASLCAFGQATPDPVETLLARHFSA